MLSKLNADRANGTNYFIPKFGDKVKDIFSGLPKPKDARKFLENDLMLLFTASDVQRFALEHRLNKAQTKAVDALLLEFSDEYAPLSTIQEPKWRVRTLLSKLNSDRRHETDYFAPKFGGKVTEIFDGLPKPKDARKFLENDLMLLFTANDVQRFALEHRLNKAQYSGR